MILKSLFIKSMVYAMLFICPIVNGTRVSVTNNASFPIIYKLAYWGFLIPSTHLGQGETKIENIPNEIECPMTCDFVCTDQRRIYGTLVTVNHCSNISIEEKKANIPIIIMSRLLRMN